MPATVYWVDEPHIMRADYTGNVVAADIEAVMGRCLEVVEKHHCFFLVDMSGITGIPTQVMKISPLVKFVNHPNTGWFVFVGPNGPLLKFAIQVLLIRKKFKIMSTAEEGIAFLRERVQFEILSPAQASAANPE